MAEEERPKISELATVPIQLTQWYTLGLTLGLEEEVLKNIEVEQSHKQLKCKRTMFRKWLESTPTASWNDLIKALVHIGEEETAEKVRKVFSPSQPTGSADLQSGGHHHSNDSDGDDGVCDMVSCSQVLQYQ